MDDEYRKGLLISLCGDDWKAVAEMVDLQDPGCDYDKFLSIMIGKELQRKTSGNATGDNAAKALGAAGTSTNEGAVRYDKV